MTTAQTLLAGLAAVTGVAHAQPNDTSPDKTRQTQEPPAAITQAQQSPVFNASLNGWYGFGADFDAGPGDVSVARARLDLSMTLAPTARSRLTLGIEVEESWYDFDGATGLDPSGDPFDNATNVDFFANYSAPLNDDTNYFVLGSVGFAGESGADFGDALIYGGGLGFVVRRSPTFSWGLGVIVRTRLEDDALVLPLPQITWNISDRWTLDSRRAGLRLEYAANDSLTYGLGVQFDSRTFRLDEDGVIPDGVATDRRIPV
ncbi:MAG: DUF6268 family outer membrane beta-barrel protein, partial [Planctomycetota bacterium]